MLRRNFLKLCGLVPFIGVNNLISKERPTFVGIFFTERYQKCNNVRWDYVKQVFIKNV